MSFISSLWFAVVGSLFVLCVSAQEFSIEGFIISGTGCAPGSVNATISSNTKNLTVKYNGFTARAGPNYGYDDNRKNCQLTLSVSVSAGYQFGFDKYTHNGAYSINSGVTATHRTSYYFQGSLDESNGSTKIVGPSKDDGSFSGSLSPTSWSACGKSSLVGINTDVRVENSANSAASGWFTISNSPPLNFVWQKC